MVFLMQPFVSYSSSSHSVGARDLERSKGIRHQPRVTVPAAGESTMRTALSKQRVAAIATAATVALFILVTFSSGGDAPSWSSEQMGECGRDDILVHQEMTTPMPNGMPTYTVQVLNVCTGNCSIGDIHLRCGLFSSARLIDPVLFRRLGLDDCLVNDGRPLRAGFSISFQYANSVRFPMDVSSFVCLPSSYLSQSP